MSPSGFLADRKNRRLAFLLAAALLSGLAAFFALHQRSAEVAPKNEAQMLFPGLAHAISAGQVTHVHIASKTGGAFDVDFVPQKGWILPGRNNYPASFEEVKKVLVAMAAMETIEPKTDRPDWFHYIDVDGPPAGNGLAITLAGDKGHVYAALIVGKSEEIGDDSGGIGLFVRKPDDNQTWLVRSPTEIRPSQTDWMDKTVLDIDRGLVSQVDIRPASGPSYTVRRAKPTDEFTLAPLPKGREISYSGALDNIAAVLDDFTFDDVKPVGTFDFTNASRLVMRTFKGLVVTADVVKQGDNFWARVSADADPGMSDAARQAHDINQRAAGWAFQLASYKGAVFVATLDSLLKPKK
jgi:hypothetical protein